MCLSTVVVCVHTICVPVPVSVSWCVRVLPSCSPGREDFAQMDFGLSSAAEPNTLTSMTSYSQDQVHRAATHRRRQSRATPVYTLQTTWRPVTVRAMRWFCSNYKHLNLKTLSYNFCSVYSDLFILHADVNPDSLCANEFDQVCKGRKEGRIFNTLK